jgi:hypothetical protein
MKNTGVMQEEKAKIKRIRMNDNGIFSKYSMKILLYQGANCIKRENIQKLR